MNILDRNKDITLINFPQNQFIDQNSEKFQIYLHHTAGNSDPFGVFKDWKSNPEKIATCVVIGGTPRKNSPFHDGQIVQGFSSKKWAYHLGLRESTFNNFNLPYMSLDRISIGIEICNWGQLTYNEGKYYNWVGNPIPNEQVITLSTPFRGYRYFHNYTDKQIESVEKLLRYWGDVYDIPLTYKDNVFEVNENALSGEPGVYTHCSVRYDKIDVYPHPKLIEMLKSL